MAGRPRSADDNDNGGANGNACGNTDDVGSSDWRGSDPLLDLDALVVFIVNIDANEGPPFISGPDPAGLFGRPKTHGVPYPPGLRFTYFISPRTRKKSIKIRPDRRRCRFRGNK